MQKIENYDYLIDNDGTLEELYDKIDQLILNINNNDKKEDELNDKIPILSPDFVQLKRKKQSEDDSEEKRKKFY